MAELLATMRAKALMSPLMLLTCMHRLTRLGMVRKTPSSCSPPGSVPSSLGPVATLCTCSTKSKTLTTEGWLRRSPASTSLIKKPPNLLHKSRSYTKSSMRPTMPKPCPRSDWSSPMQPRRRLNLKTSQRRLACCPHTLITKTVNKDISSN